LHKLIGAGCFRWKLGNLFRQGSRTCERVGLEELAIGWCPWLDAVHATDVTSATTLRSRPRRRL